MNGNRCQRQTPGGFADNGTCILVSVSGDQYRFEIDPVSLAYYLDSLGSTTVDRADMEATINDGTLTALKLDLEGVYRIQDQILSPWNSGTFFHPGYRN